MASKQLETAIRALEQCIEVLKKHTDSGGMMDELDLIRKQMSEGRRADASVRLIALEQRVAHAQLFAPSGGLEHVFGESEQLVGGRVIEYVPSANGPPISLDPTMPRPRDATGQKLLAIVRRTIEEFNSKGLLTDR
jgi:hypothetical protein